MAHPWDNIHCIMSTGFPTSRSKLYTALGYRSIRNEQLYAINDGILFLNRKMCKMYVLVGLCHLIRGLYYLARQNQIMKERPKLCSARRTPKILGLFWLICFLWKFESKTLKLWGGLTDARDYSLRCLLWPSDEIWKKFPTTIYEVSFVLISIKIKVKVTGEYFLCPFGTISTFISFHSHWNFALSFKLRHHFIFVIHVLHMFSFGSKTNLPPVPVISLFQKS